MLDIAALRAATPACEAAIHLDSAGSSLPPLPVQEAVARHLAREAEVGGYRAEAEAGLDALNREAAALIGGRPEEIAWVENATRAWDMAFHALPLGPGDRVVTHRADYASNMLALLATARRLGIEIDVAPDDADGTVDVAALEAMIGPRTRAVLLCHVPTQGGAVEPAAEVGAVAARHGLFYLLDACQSVGQLDLDVRAIGCHALSATGRKWLRGPRGTGFLWVAAEWIERLDPPFVDLRAATWTEDRGYALAPGARRFETWESFVAGRVGLAVAIRLAREAGMPAIEARVTALGATLREALAALPGVTVHDRGARRCGIVTFLKEGVAPDDLAARLDAAGARVSVSRLASARLDLGARGLPALVRASPHAFNTEDELDRFAAMVRDA